MNSLYPGEENINITDNYYTFIKQLTEDFLKYITNYKLSTGEYLKKISLNHEKYSPRLIEIKEQLKNINVGHIISVTSIVPKVIEQQIINIEYFVEGFDEKLVKFEKLIKEKNVEYLDCINSFKDKKNELIKKYREIDKIKTNFMTNINIAEETIHKFYMKQNNKKKTNSKLNNSQLDISHELNYVSFEEQVNNSIQKTKKLEDEYKTNIILVKKIEKNYIETTDNAKEKTRNILSEIANSLKELISDCIVFLRNSFKIPLSEIDTYINEVVNLDEYDKVDKLIKSSYKKDANLKPINTEKYILQIFQNNGSNINNINNKKISLLEEGLQEMDFVQEEEIFMTIKKMMENFDLLENNNFDLISEEEKLRCKYLTLKILSFAPKSKLYSNQVPNITQEEVEEMTDMLQKKKNRVIFIQKLSQFRTRGIFEFPEREYNILSRLFNKIVKIIESEGDYDSAVNIIILSQTYYIIKNNKKEYLQNVIMDNELFKTKKFWETFVNYSITKEISLSKKTDMENGIIINDDKEKEEKESNIVFAQLVPITDNMIEFGLNINIVEEIILPLIKQYKINPEFSEIVISAINNKKKEIENLNKENNNIINNNI